MHEKKQILVAEDFEDCRLLMTLYLRQLGYAVTEAGNGEEALERVKFNRPDLILMDISMPRMNGLEALSVLKGNPDTRDIPIVIMTAHVQRSQTNDALRAGAVDVIFKPFNLLQLGNALGRYFLPPEDGIGFAAKQVHNKELSIGFHEPQLDDVLLVNSQKFYPCRIGAVKR